ncbi:response regulator [bacterium AH-315-P13]|nr:response regulator [bacterium AH-315-P13]MBN4085310.1 response regulator [Flavobacteriaceae bacterium AH-315-B10]
MKKTKHIVLIDDNKIDCFINQKIISIASKHSITKIFNSGNTALDYITKILKRSEFETLFNIDLILLDINMPVMNGFEFLDKLTKMKAFMKNPIEVHFLSSSNNEKDISDALKNKFCSGYINKPLTKEKISKLIVSKQTKELKLKRKLNS